MASQRKKKLALNTVSSLIYQAAAIVCSFVIPRCILVFYGSSVNGLISSINQFLQIITFLELGIGVVVQSSLYKPLYEKKYDTISKIWVSANKFFRRIALILFFYVVFLVFGFPLIVDTEFDFWYTATLIIAISISTFAQYYFGIVNQLLLTADQRGYISFSIQIAVYAANIAACVGLIYAGASIQIVKLTTSVLFLIRPVLLYLYVRKHYRIDHKIKYDEEPIKQKWNGVAQHITSVVIDGTDTIVLSVLSTMENVSIYSVYHLVIYGVKTLFMSMINGVQALLGEIVAKGDKEEIRKFFSRIEWLLHTLVVFVFGCTGMLVLPFVRIYTDSVNDVNYIVPLFAYLITVAHGFHCLRLPYHIMIKAFGEYKNTQNNYIIAAVINIVVSVVTVMFWGLVGVAIGTLVAMGFQTIWMAWYNAKHLIQISMKSFFKQLFVDALTVAIAVTASSFLELAKVNYFWWAVLAVEIAVIWLVIVTVINLIFYKERTLDLLNGAKSSLKKLHKAG